ncbi:hypothetical protein [Archangium lipolyticum]|uniref:hypothetical protein n=1 Tax=Archangium lipolyticum TaxID=2970465 RepID=UPI002149A5DF|nr:hypothetical protein [Archangium lipolyticum]
MADKRKTGTGKRTVVRRRRAAKGGTAGRLAVRRDTAPYRRAASEEFVGEVRERIDAALAEGRRMREDIEKRIDQRLAEEENEASTLLSQLTARARLRALKPPEPHEKSAKTGRSSKHSK